MWKWIESKHDTLYAIFRVFIGLLFMQHGLQKILGMFGGMGDGASAAVFSMMWFAGYIELIGGLAITVGFFTRLAAAIAALELAIAYLIAHIFTMSTELGMDFTFNSAIPLLNGGELALLFFFSFLTILGHGAVKWSLERKLLKREVF